MKKKVIILIYSVILIIFIKLLLNFVLNTSFIFLYNKGTYKTNILKPLKILNVFEPYIVYYNMGNSYYNNDEFLLAEKEYKKALEKNVPKKRVCDVRLNLALTMIREKENGTNYSYDDIKKVLYEDDCAKPDEENGNDEASDELEKEISKKQKEEENKQGENYEQEQEQIKKEQEEANKERQDEMDSYDSSDGDSYGNNGYNGKKW